MTDDLKNIPRRSERAAIDRGPLEDTFGFLLKAAWRDAARTFAKHFRNFDINPQQYATLVLVNINPGCSTGDLAETLGITPNNMVRLVDFLAERDLLKKSTHPADKRVRVLHLTPNGRAWLSKLVEAHERFDAEFAQRIGKQRLDDLCEILRKFD